MPETRPALETLEIRRPCPVAWETLQGDDRVRFCAQCRRNVFDLSALTRHEAAELIERTEGRICVQLYRRADGTILTADCSQRERLTRRAAALVSTALALVGVACNLFGCVTRLGGEPCFRPDGVPPSRPGAQQSEKDQDDPNGKKTTGPPTRE